MHTCVFTKNAAPVAPFATSKAVSSLLRYGENAAAPAVNATAADMMRGVGGAGMGALNLAGSAAKATGRGAANVARNQYVRKGLKGALGLALKGYNLPYIGASWTAGKMGASPRLAGAIGGGALLSAYLGREAYRNGGSLDLSNLGTYGNMLLNPARDAWNITAGGLGRLYSGSEDTSGLATKSEVGATDADAQRKAHAAQNAGVTAQPDIQS